MEQLPGDGHVYVHTVIGRCLRCKGYEDEHQPRLVYLPEPDPLTECPVDHASLITAHYLRSAGGYEWLRCPICTVMVEPKYASAVDPKVVGPSTGPGRGDISPAYMSFLLEHVWTELYDPR